jgi:phage virion morphogenesis protein
MIEVEWDSREVLAALQQLQNRISNLRPALAEIGEKLTESTQQRFASEQTPQGTAWAANSPVTVAKKGGQPILTDGGMLGSTIDYQLLGNDGVAIGSPMEYAAMMQFGGTKSEFPHLWGDIPAREFLGVSDADRDQILDTLSRYLQD